MDFWGHDPLNGQQPHRDPWNAPPCAEARTRCIDGPPVFCTAQRFTQTPKSYAFSSFTMLFNKPDTPKVSLPMAASVPHVIHGFLGPSYILNGFSIGSFQPFLHSSRRSFYTLQWAASSPPQDCPGFACGNLDPHLTHGFLGPPDFTS